jgi:secreted Zn-dependent insulinase-like peptidase
MKYVPSHLVLINDTAGEVPHKLENSGGAEVWWLGKGAFSQPKAQLRAKLTVPKELFATPELAAMRRLHAELSNQGLEEPMEDLSACGLSWDLTDSSDGYQLSMDGYSEHIAALVSEVATGIHQPPSDADRFTRAKQKLITSLEDTTSKMPYEHAMEALSVVSTNSVFSRLEMIAALKATTLDAFKSYLVDLNAHGVRIQFLVTGNVDADGAKHLSKTLATGLGAKKVIGKDKAAKSLAVRVQRDVEVRMENPIPQDSNNAVINAYQFGIPDVADRVKLLMLGKMISQPAYDELRTKQQLGYVVFAVMMPHLATLELVMIVQGAKKSPDDVDSRIESVLDTFMHNLHNLSSSEFENWKDSLRSTINIKDQNMAQEADRIWGQIVSDELCFNRKQMALDFLDSFQTPSDLAVEFERMRTGPRKISVRLFGAKSTMNTTQALSTLPNTTSLAEAKSSLVVYNDAQADKAIVVQGQGKDQGQQYWTSKAICSIHQ